MEVKEIKLTWTCTSCKDVLTSSSLERHKMDVCKCGLSGIDLEDGYQRGFGYVQELNRDLFKIEINNESDI